jgi:hypothetical protein
MGSNISVIRREILRMRICCIPRRCHLLGGGLYLTSQKAHLSLPENVNTNVYCTCGVKFRLICAAALTRGSIRLGDVARAGCSVVDVATTLQPARSGVRIPTVANNFSLL